MTTIAYSQTANFKTCEIAHFATSRGYVACGGRIEGQFCEFDHIQDIDNIQDQEFDAVLSEKSCQHGLSLWLCSGPGHYPQDNFS